jgi:hypothetical protein
MSWTQTAGTVPQNEGDQKQKDIDIFLFFAYK